MANKKVKSRYWSIIAYPDSVPSLWLDILTSTGLQMAISPLHDRDIDPEADSDEDRLKKPHWHILVCFDGPTTRENVEGIAERIGTQVVTPVNSCRGMYRYHLHLDNPEKAQYNDSDRSFINGFLIENYSSLTASEELQMIDLIHRYIDTEEIYEYCDLIDFLQTEDIQAFNYAVHHVLMFNTYIRSKFNKLKSDISALKMQYKNLYASIENVHEFNSFCANKK